jgi:hypothetical protein
MRTKLPFQQHKSQYHPRITMTNLFTEAEAINAPPGDRETPRAETLLHKYSLLDIPADLLETLKNAERGFHMRRQESDLAVLLHGMAEDHQDVCEAALLTAMILAQSQAKALDAQEMAAAEDFGRVKKAKGDKGAGKENTEDDKAGLGEEKNGGDSQVKGLDTSSGKGKNSKGKTGAARMGVKEEDLGVVFTLLIVVYVLYKILC